MLPQLRASSKRVTSRILAMALPRQRARALLLLAAFVGGGVFSPAVHYGYMALSGRWDGGVHSAHHADHAVTHGQAAVHEHTPASVSGGLVIAGDEDGAIPCHYADLFATFAATFATQSAVNPSFRAAGSSQHPVEIPEFESRLSFRSRAPPVLA